MLRVRARPALRAMHLNTDERQRTVAARPYNQQKWKFRSRQLLLVSLLEVPLAPREALRPAPLQSIISDSSDAGDMHHYVILASKYASSWSNEFGYVVHNHRALSLEFRRKSRIMFSKSLSPKACSKKLGRD